MIYSICFTGVEDKVTGRALLSGSPACVKIAAKPKKECLCRCSGFTNSLPVTKTGGRPKKDNAARMDAYIVTVKAAEK